MDREIGQVNDNFSIKVVRDLNEFGKLKDIWNSLAESCESYTPWLSFDWFNLCLKYFLGTSRLLVILLYEEDRIVAIAPFVVKNEKFKGTVQTRKIELLGNVHSPIRNVLVGNSNKERKTSIILNIFRYLCDQYKEWDIIELDRIPEENSFFGVFNDVLSNIGLNFRTSFSAGNWYLDGIDYSFSQYFENLPKKIQKDVQYCRRRLGKMGNLEFQIELDNGSLDHYLDLYDKVRAKSWKAPEKDKTFIREFTKLTAERGWMRFAFLRYNDVPIACQKWIICEQKAYIWDVLHDEDYGKHSPGKILSTDVSQYVFDRDKVIEIDFLTGDEPYKKDWTPKRRERKGITIFNKTLRGQFLSFLMTKFLPVMEKNQSILIAKKKVSGYLKKLSHQ
jgi:CelD/BcsL family acetyltransferase involved in cellulose biosynthesis